MNWKCRRALRCVNKSLSNRQLHDVTSLHIDRDSVGASRRFSIGAQRSAQLRFGTWITALAWIACASPPSEPVILPPVVVEMPDHFSGEIAKSHLDWLSVQAPRSPGSDADRAAREYLS